MSDYYRPTPGEAVGTYNVFHRDGRTEANVPYEDLPAEVRAMLRAK